MATDPEFFFVLREGDAADPENAVDRMIIDDRQLLRDIGRLIAARLGVTIAASRGRASPIVVPLKADQEGER